MSAGQYYWSQNLIKGFGKMWFPLALKSLKDENDESLLGSVVQQLGSVFLFVGSHYPAPYHMTTPNLILRRLNELRQEIGLQNGDEIVTREHLVVPGQTLKITKKTAVKGDIGPFPAIPASVNFDIDYSRMESVTISFGDNTEIRYIAVDYLARLYKYLNGDANQIDPGIAVEIDENYIVDQVLIAREFDVQFESQAEFSMSIDAKIDQANAEAGGGVLFSKTTERTITARIQGEKSYLVGFSISDWDDFG